MKFDGRTNAGVEYEYRSITFSRVTHRSEVKVALTEAAEYGHWELDRVLLYIGGARRVRLRRRIIRVQRTT